MRVSNNTAHEALLAWADWVVEGAAARCAKYGGGSHGTHDRAHDDPRTPWRVLTVATALKESRQLEAAARRLYLGADTMTRPSAHRRKQALLTRVAQALDTGYYWDGEYCKPPSEETISTSAIKAVRAAKS